MPLAVTDCLNFANPEKPDNFWQFRRAVEGLADACEAFACPVISGNVSFYNETPERAIFPTPTIGMVGLIENAERRVTMAFQKEGDSIFLVGGGVPTFGGSEYLSVVHGMEVGTPPALDMDAEKRVQAFVRDAISQGLLRSAHDVSDGGLAVCLAECCMAGGIGANVNDLENVDALTLFGERTASVVVTASDDFALWTLAASYSVECVRIGKVMWDVLSFEGSNEDDTPNVPCEVSVAAMHDAYEGAIPRAMNGE